MMCLRGLPRPVNFGCLFFGRLALRTALFVVALAATGCGSGSAPVPLAFPSGAAGQLEIEYPSDETLFPPEIVAPTFLWQDETPGVQSWSVLARFSGSDEVLRFETSEPSWRPSETDWEQIKQRSQEQDAEFAVVGLDQGSEIVVYCRSGGRSGWAVQQLVDAGYEQVHNLTGGILGWRAQVDPSLTAY